MQNTSYLFYNGQQFSCPTDDCVNCSQFRICPLLDNNLTTHCPYCNSANITLLDSDNYIICGACGAILDVQEAAS